MVENYAFPKKIMELEKVKIERDRKKKNLSREAAGEQEKKIKIITTVIIMK